MKNKLSFPGVDGGKVTNATFDVNNSIVELWVSLDPGKTSIVFTSDFDVSVGARIHLNTVVDQVAK